MDRPPAGSGRNPKSPAAFRTTTEVAEELGLEAHVLRFWESKFPQLKPLKRGGGRRYYRPEDIALLSRIRECLYQEGYTIRGVQKLLSEGGLDTGAAPGEIAPSLFPLDPLPEPAPAAPAPARPARGARRASPSAEPVEAGERPSKPTAISSEARVALEAAAQDLLSARQMLDALLHKTGG